jgi:hypothetical protein
MPIGSSPAILILWTVDEPLEVMSTVELEQLSCSPLVETITVGEGIL